MNAARPGRPTLLGRVGQRLRQPLDGRMPTAEAIVSGTDFLAAFLTSFLGPITPWIFISATTSSRAKTLLTTLCAE